MIDYLRQGSEENLIMERDPQRATVHLVTQQELGIADEKLDFILSECENRVANEHRLLRDNILKLLQKRGRIFIEVI